MSQPASTTPSENGGRQQSRSRRGRSRTPRSPSVSSDISEPAPAATGQRKNRRRGGNKGGLPAVDEGEDNSQAVAGRDNQAANQNPEGEGGGGKNQPVRLRLDLNLSVEVEIKARIHGDLTLSLL